MRRFTQNDPKGTQKDFMDHVKMKIKLMQLLSQ